MSFIKKKWLFQIGGILFLFSANGQNASDDPTKLPNPNGPFGVGTTFLNFVDSTRNESFDSTKNYRNVFVKFWYPSKKSGNEGEVYLEKPSQALSIILDLFRLPKSFFDQLSSVKTHSVFNTEPSNKKKKYPLVIFQHGYSFWVNQNTILMEHLASNGFVVASISHAYETCYELDDDGKLNPFSFSNMELSKRWAEILNEDISAVVGKILETKDLEEASIYEHQLLDLTPMLQKSVYEWSADAAFVINQLEKLNKSDHLLGGKLDLEKIGAVGMSFGGAATAQWIIEDDRIKAGINMDGGIRGDLLDVPIKKTFMFMVSDNHEYLNNTYFQNAEGPSYFLKINGARHLDFCDLNVIAPEFLKPLGLAGSIEKGKMNNIINDLCLSFFQKHLTNQRIEIPQYEEVIMRQRNTE